MLTITIPNLPAVQADVADLGARAQQQRPALEEARDEVEAVFGEKFAAEGPGWAKHRPLTEDKRAGMGSSGAILYETGKLEASYRRGGPDHVEWWSPVSVEVGSALKYAAPHEDGFRNIGTVPETPANRMVYMRGQRVAARPLLTIDTNNADNRIADRYAEALFRMLGL